MLLALAGALLVLAAALAHPDLKLVKGALAGRRAALRMLVRRLLPVVHARARVFLSRRPDRRIAGKDADDLTQEVWLSLLDDDGRLLRAWDPDRGMALEGYVGLLTRRQLWRNIEASSAQKRGGGVAPVALESAPEPVAPDDPERATMSAQLLARLRAHLFEQLPARGQLVYAALYEDGRDVSQTAEVLGVNRQVVYNWQHRIRKLARGFFAEVH